MPTITEVMENVKTLNDEEKSQLLLEVISGSSVSWLKDFVKSFEDKFGVSAAMPMMAAAGPATAAAGEGAEKKEEKTSFDVILTDTPPQPVKTGVTKEEAEKILKELAAAGAKVELK